jgi:hypothetical protein
MPRYKCKSIAALDIALGGLPAKMHVEARRSMASRTRARPQRQKFLNRSGANSV